MLRSVIEGGVACHDDGLIWRFVEELVKDRNGKGIERSKMYMPFVTFATAFVMGAFFADLGPTAIRIICVAKTCTTNNEILVGS